MSQLQDMKQKIAFFFAEGGVPPSVLAQCDARVFLPGVDGTDSVPIAGDSCEALQTEVQTLIDQDSVKITSARVQHGAGYQETSRIGTSCLQGYSRDDISIESHNLAQDMAFQPGHHLSPQEFHDMLRTAASSQDVVLFDARNVYETNIGSFSAPGCQLIDPKTRQFTDIPRYLVEHREDLVAAAQGKKVLMYCTGGVRCERASQLLRLVLEKEPPKSESGCAADQLEIYQLQGGINSYLDQFPSDHGGFFHGRNFQFDERMSMPASSSGDAWQIGRCIQCKQLWDDYVVADARCHRCRMRILLCKDCCQSRDQQPDLMCELCCQEHTVQS